MNFDMNCWTKFFAALLLLGIIAVPSVAQNSQGAEWLYQEGRQAFYQNDFEQARHNFERLLEQDSSHDYEIQSHYFMGRILKETDRAPLAALDHLYQVYSYDQRTTITDDALYYIGVIYEDELERPETAVPYYNHITKFFEESDYHDSATQRLDRVLAEQQIEPNNYSLDNIPPPTMKLNFDDIDLEDFVRTYSDLSGKNFLFEATPKGSVTLITQRGIPIDNLFDLFVNVLESKGFTVVKQEGIYHVKKLGNRFDAGAGFTGESEAYRTRLFELGDLPANDIKSLFSSVLSTQHRFQQLQDLNLILITARPGELEEAENLLTVLRSMERPPGSLVSFTYSPRYIQANQLKTNLQSHLNSTLPNQPVSLHSNSANNQLVVVAPRAVQNEIHQAIQRYDRDIVQDLNIRVFTLEHANEDAVVDKLNNLLSVLPSNIQKNRVRIEADNRQNAVIVSSVSPRILSLAEQVIDDLDRKNQSTPDNVRVYPLEHAEAEPVSETLNDLMSIFPGSLPDQRYKVIPDSRRNALIVSAESRDMFPILERIIQEMDQPTENRPKNVQVYRLEYADEQKVADQLNQITEVLPGEFPTGNLKIIPDERQRAVVVSAENKKVFGVVEKVIDELDRESALTPSQHHVYQVHNSQAGPLAEKLNFLFEGDTSKESTRVTADEQTNSLIISAPEGRYADVRTMIDTLDSPKKQILVDVYIIEASQDKVDRLGIEWGAEGSIDGRDATVGTNFGLRQSGLFGLNAGIFDEDNEDLLATLTAFQSEDDFEILSTAHLVANENEAASLKVGKIVPLLKDSQVTEGGSLNRSFNFENVGIELDMVPFISGEQTVTLEIKQKLQEVQSAGRELGTPTRRNRDIQTKVAIPNHMTLVLGGVLSSNRDFSEQSVPYLSKIPGLSPLFKSKNNTEEKRNLLIFLRPHILSNNFQIEDATETLRKKQDFPTEGRNPDRLPPPIKPNSQGDTIEQ